MKNKRTKIGVGVFAYNEELNISKTIKSLARQTILENSLYEIQVYILANGCTDRTIEIGSDTIKKLGNSKIEMIDCPVKGKSATWNYFVHSLMDQDTEFGYFLDSDIIIEDPKHLHKMLLGIEKDQEVELFSSLPRKDLEFVDRKLSLTEKLILGSSGDTTNLKKALCGQFYLARLSALRKFFIPAGTAVEDGFVRAMVLTECFRQPENINKIQIQENIFHVFESERTLFGVINHQVRLVIGTSINMLLFRYFHEEAKQGKTTALLEDLKSEDWLRKFLSDRLPKWPYGYISFHVVTKRFLNLHRNKSLSLPKKIVKITVGGTFDILVYLIASAKMARGHGVGYW